MQRTTILYKNLSSLAPEIKECVDACNFISKSTRDQNTNGAVSRLGPTQEKLPPPPRSPSLPV